MLVVGATEPRRGSRGCAARWWARAGASSDRRRRSGTAARVSGADRSPDGRPPRRSRGRRSCGWSEHPAGVDGRRRGHARADQHSHRLVEIWAAAAHAARCCVEQVVVRPPTGEGGELGIERPVGLAEHVDQRGPLLVGRDRHGEPLLAARARVEALRRGPAGCGCPRARARCRRPSTRSPARPRRRSAASNIGASTKHPSPVRSRRASADERGERRVHPAVGIARPALDARLVVGNAGQPREAGHLLHRLREPGPVAPGPGEPERRHPHHHGARVGARG